MDKQHLIDVLREAVEDIYQHDYKSRQLSEKQTEEIDILLKLIRALDN